MSCFLRVAVLLDTMKQQGFFASRHASCACTGTWQFHNVRSLTSPNVLPCSLACAVKFSFAALAFSPVLWNVLTSEKSKDKKTVLAGIELGMWLMAGIVSQTVGMKSGSSSISLLFTFTIILVPLLEVSTGRRSISQFTWLASLAALTGASSKADCLFLRSELHLAELCLKGLFASLETQECLKRATVKIKQPS